VLYGNTTLATKFGRDAWQVKALRFLLFFIPRANPDNEKFYPLIKKWCLEIDDNGEPVREIGIDTKGEPLFAAPDKRNVGFWTDSDKTFNLNELEIVSAEQFEQLWHKICSKS
jgi:hypothetical protein